MRGTAGRSTAVGIGLLVAACSLAAVLVAGLFSAALPSQPALAADTTARAGQAVDAEAAGAEAGKVYYVDSSGGNDDNDGLSPGSSWQTLDRVRDTTVPGDSILFKRGETWRGQLTAVVSGTSTAYITYGAYGDKSLPKPLILGSEDLSSTGRWTQVSSHVWRAGGIDKDVGNVIFDNESSVGRKRSSQSELIGQGDFYYNSTGKHLYMYSATNPGAYYSHIEAAKRQHGFYTGGANYIKVRDLSFRYQGAHGAQVNSQTHHVTIEHCDFAWDGGCYSGGTTRIGNGIELYESCNNITLRHNTIDNVFDEGITLQGFGNPSTVDNVHVYGNVITNCKAGISAYYHAGPTVFSNVAICHNVIYRTGGGWSDSDNVRCGFYSSGFQGTEVTNCRFSNNIIHTSLGEALVVWKPADQVAPGWIFDYNCYYPDSSAAFEHDADHFVDFGTWTSLTGQEAHSMVVDPRFVDAAHGDFRLAIGSPCVGAGVVVSNAGQTPGALPNIGMHP